MTLVSVCDTGELKPGKGRTFDVGSASIALFNVAGTFYAIDDTCSHAGGPLGEGDWTAPS